MTPDFEETFLSLLEAHKGLIYKISHAYAVTIEDRKDLFQEIVLSLWRAYPSFKQNSKISTWIYRVGLYTAITNFRRETKQIKYEQLQTAYYEKSIADFQDYEDADIKSLYLAIGKLSKVDKAIIILLLEENSYTEISNIMGIKSGAVGMRIRRAKDKLARLLTNINT
jgi:RNA polymerase sigma factor (sigma-70 family)